MGKQSMRQIAKELDISPAYLSYMVNGKRTWRKDLYQRYIGVVNTFVNSEPESVNNQVKRPPQQAATLGVNYVGAGRGIRTHTPAKVADFKSAASTIPPSRLSKLGLHCFRPWGDPNSERGAGGGLGSNWKRVGGDGRIRTAE